MCSSFTGRVSGMNSPNNIAPRANCEPELQVVELPKPSDSLTVIWPSCIRINRCGGCCSSSLLQCVPKRTSTVHLKVLKARYPEVGAEMFQFQNFEVIGIEKHDKCSCECKQKPSDCTNLQTYQHNLCQCVCINSNIAGTCTNKQIWDSRDCACKCKNSTDCSTGNFFNHQTCRLPCGRM
ncbi:vascular endothelial growth factor A-like isoform X2 [Limulus polyphemus]|uniref:Vascular endothelial growth factor A-like isoform X2 n=1 Tax=Limulus polyphemus TaxID=6850 RepID=A0ABM1RYE5_LIMPO|nr:vascular endothelial growth factor A-like isoform X2 [Limulus polyphemus]